MRRRRHALNHEELIRETALLANCPLAQARRVLEAAMDLITDACAHGGTARVASFGTFYPKRQRPKRAVLGGKQLNLPASRALGFRAAKAVRWKEEG